MDLEAALRAELGDRYAFEHELGGGGMSRVFVAKERALGRRVVVKVLPPELAAEVSVERFNLEVRTTAVLQHPNIVTVLAAGEVARLPYYTMPYVDGMSLRARLDRDGPIPAAEVTGLLRDIAKALAYAHARGVVHRDVKPANVLLSAGTAVVTDFGLAKAISEARSPAPHRPPISGSGAAVGTPAYMAPEQVRGDRRVDHRADLYAFGVMAYEMLTGRLPDRHPTGEVSRMLGRDRITPVLADLIERCLAPAAEDRPEDAAALVRVLESLPGPGRTRDVPGIRRLAIVVAAGAILGAVALFRVWSGASDASMPRSVAVVAGTGADTANAYFTDGVADELATALEKIRGLKVIPRSSTAASVAGVAGDLRRLGKALDVEAILSLRITRDSGRVRINAQMTNTADGHLVFAQDVEADAQRVLSAQDTLVRAIVGALRLRFMSAGAQPIISHAVVNAEAHDLYLRGRRFLQADELRRAVEFFDRALRIDSAYALAETGRADALFLQAAHGFAPPADVMPAAKAAALRALSLDSTQAAAHVALGNIARSWEYDRALAGREFERAVALDPQYAEGRLARAWWRMDQGQVEAALGEARAAVALDPLSQRMRSDLGHMHLLAGHVDSAATHFDQLAENDSSNGTVRLLQARARLAAGRTDQGRALLRQSGFDSARVDVELARWMRPALSAADASRALARQQAAARVRYVSGEAEAVLRLRAGDRTGALAALERGFREHALSPELAVLPEFATLRGDPRFARILTGMGVGPASGAMER